MNDYIHKINREISLQPIFMKNFNLHNLIKPCLCKKTDLNGKLFIFWYGYLVQ